MLIKNYCDLFSAILRFCTSINRQNIKALYDDYAVIKALYDDYAHSILYIYLLRIQS